MLLNTQSNPHWAYDAMGLPTDYMKDWACLVTAIANIYDIMPNDLNKWLRENGGYYGKGFPNQESFLKWDVIEKHLNFKHIVVDKVLPDNNFYIARILHKKYRTGHYCNLLNYDETDKTYEIFDTDYGTELTYNKDQVKLLIQIIKGA